MIMRRDSNAPCVDPSYGCDAHPFPARADLVKAKEFRTDGQPRPRTSPPYDDVAFAAPGRVAYGAAPNPAPGLQARREPRRTIL